MFLYLVAMCRLCDANRPRLLPIHLVIALSAHAYASSNSQDPFRAIATGLRSLAIAVGTVILPPQQHGLPRLTIASGFAQTIVPMAVARYFSCGRTTAAVGSASF
ncbi:hypothetical protein [Sphingomonas sp. Leaf17]|uniref:hypothetical protein n=1 Tax=Sphingomonas sp. Leaf17 TaxID=1735683 RepID=UPI0012E191E0|nr:hypothetical protein [Sphingomonas sp. Leaf17]